jgi:uncharacterized membrane protein
MDASVLHGHPRGVVRSKRLMFLIVIGMVLWAMSVFWREVKKRLFAHGTFVGAAGVGQAGAGPT